MVGIITSVLKPLLAHPLGPSRALMTAWRADIGSSAIEAVRVTTIYKICDRRLWQAAEAERVFRGSRDDTRDGFIHFSTADQLAETAAKHFAGQTDLILVAVDVERLGPQLQWETSRGGALFPHLYAPLPLEAVRWVRPLADEVDGRRSLPELDAEPQP